MSPRHLLAPLMLALAAASALAQDVRVFSASEAVDPHEVATILDPSRLAATTGQGGAMLPGKNEGYG